MLGFRHTGRGDPAESAPRREGGVMGRKSFRVLKMAATGVVLAAVSMVSPSVGAATNSVTTSSARYSTGDAAPLAFRDSDSVGSVTEYLTNGEESDPTSQTTLPLTSVTKGKITLDPTTTYQTIDGFGATLTDSSAADLMALSPSDRSSVMNDLFNPTTGAGISLIRIGIGATDFSPFSFTYDDTTDGQPDPKLTNFSITQNDNGSLPDTTEIIPLLQEALSINPKLQVIATPWTPPPWMKSNPIYQGAYFTSTKKGKLKQVDVSFNTVYYQAYANYFVKFIQAYEADGVTINYVTPQNEPEYAPTTYPGMLLPESEEATFVQNYLSPALSKYTPSTKVLGYDHNWNDTKYPSSLLTDAPSIAGIAWHCYKGSVKSQSVVASNSAYSGKSTFITECSGTGPQSSSGTTEPYFENNLDWDATNLIVGGLSNYASGVQLYNLALDENCGPQLNGGTTCYVPPKNAPNDGCQDCRGVVTITTNPPASLADENVEYYLLAAANEAFSPGSVRIKTTAKGGMQAVAATNPDGTTGLFVANTSSKPITKPLTVDDDGYGFTFSIPANSVASFRWTNPSTGNWQLQSFPNPVDNTTAWPQAVSCVSDTFCEALGTYQSSAGGGDWAVFDDWNGSVWALQSQPAPVDSQLLGVSCVSPTFCEAVGTEFNGSSFSALTELWNGTNWTIQTTPNAAGNVVILDSVSCSSTTFCETLGSSETADGDYSNLAEVWNGTKWAMQSITGNGSPGGLSGVSCTSTSFCYAVGSQEAYRWNGTKWSGQPKAPEAGSVSCISDRSCEAVSGSSAEGWNGTKWTVQSLAPSGNDAGLEAVSCPSSGFCVAVGNDGSGGTLAEVWDGTTWTIQASPNPTSNSSSGLSEVSCSSVSYCEAVGAEASTSSSPQVIIAEGFG
jgi:O-glycosyl hydrolase